MKQKKQSSMPTPDITPMFKGELSRAFIAEAVKTIREERKLSIRAAANAAGVAKTDIVRIEAEEATLDKGLAALKGLGYTLSPIELRAE